MGSPTAPKMTASAARALAMSSSEIALPQASYAAPPTRPSSVSKVEPPRALNQPMIFFTPAMISVPMPSPGRSRRLCVAMGVSAPCSLRLSAILLKAGEAVGKAGRVLSSTVHRLSDYARRSAISPVSSGVSATKTGHSTAASGSAAALEIASIRRPCGLIPAVCRALTKASAVRRE